MAKTISIIYINLNTLIYMRHFYEEEPSSYKQINSNFKIVPWSVFVTNEWIVKNNLDIKN